MTTSSSGYPAAARSDICDDLNGHLVADPYRWLEDPGSPATQEWLAAQDELYAGAAAGLTGRERLTGRLGELLSAGLVTSPVWRGDRQFYLRRDAGQEHAVLYTAAAGEAERALIDPTAIDPAGTTTLDAWQPDHEGRLLAYQLSQGGREESDVRVMDIATGLDVDGPIDRCRYTQVAWLPGGKAFYYSRRLAPERVPAGEEQYHRRVYLHYVGTPPDDDVLIYGGGPEGSAGPDKTAYYGVGVSRDGRWLVIESSLGTAPRNDVWVADLTASPETAPDLRVLQQGVDAQVSVRPGRDGRLYLHTDRDAPRGPGHVQQLGQVGRRLGGEQPPGLRTPLFRAADQGPPLHRGAPEPDVGLRVAGRQHRLDVPQRGLVAVREVRLGRSLFGPRDLGPDQPAPVVPAYPSAFGQGPHHPQPPAVLAELVAAELVGGQGTDPG